MHPSPSNGYCLTIVNTKLLVILKATSPLHLTEILSSYHGSPFSWPTKVHQKGPN